jgi:pyruvate,water dikinase
VSYIRWFNEIRVSDVPIVGGKNASLGEMYATLSGVGVRVPNGFAVTAQAYRDTIARAGIGPALRVQLDGLDVDDHAALARAARVCRELVYGAGIDAELTGEIAAAHAKLAAQYGASLTVAVRSSATAEDLPEASFAGQHESFLNVAGERALIDACRRCYASLYTDRAIRYRINNGFAHEGVALSIGVQKMVRADLAAAGVAFTLDTESGHRDVVFVTGAFGLGENVVQGAIDPDEFYVHKPTFRAGYRRVLRRKLGGKELKMIYGSARGGASVRNIVTSDDERARYCVDDADVVTIAANAMAIEAHYSKAAGRAVPMDIEWAKDGTDGAIYIVQARPETVASRRSTLALRTYRMRGRGDVLAQGSAVGNRIATGRVRIIRNDADLDAFATGDVLVADTTTPDWGTVMRRAAALVTNRGGRTCHAAIVARELDIPAVVGCGDATTVLAGAGDVTVSCGEGERGRVYRGALPFDVEDLDLGKLPRTRTQLMVNLGNPDLALKTAMLPADGVGLARIEFIITEYVNVHPMALVHPERVRDERVRAELARLTKGYDPPREFFVARLAEGVATIAAAFYPRPVIVRLSDFKTNEYAKLTGGADFEPKEENPMIGFRGASRYAHPAYEEGFALECAALRRVRDDMGFTNVKLMVPFCRRVDEGVKVLGAMARHGLERGRDGLEVYVMCEIPNNVVLIDEFAKHFDGFSIGSNDLTQLTLGVDRDSNIVAFDFDERDPGVLEMLRLAVIGAKRNGRHSGICGQAPSDHPDVAAFLVRLGIDSLSLNPDTLVKTLSDVAKIEASLGIAPTAAEATRS